LSYWNERWRKGDPVTISVSVADQEVGEMKHKDGEGWKPFEISTERFAGQRAAVQFDISGQRGSGRQFCFHAEAL
jgi:hypothetical protein